MLETNKYKDQMMKNNVEVMYSKQLRMASDRPGYRPKSMEDLAIKYMAEPRITVSEIHTWMGLLIANMLCHRKKLRDNWSTTSVGAIGVGTFGQFMKRDRFELIARNLHFTDNMDPRAKSDKAWKVRSIIEVLQTTFKRGHDSISNKLRQYMKDKPHIWGTKLFLLCCSQTGYCGRLEVYCGKKQHSITDEAIDSTSGPQAVVRNLARYFGSSIQVHRRMVAMDRFYTSVALSQKLNGMGFDSVGTISTSRLGWCKDITWPFKTRPKTVARGSLQLAQSKLASRPSIPCPQAVKDYLDSMGGCDRHDQLRLHSYSLQSSRKFVKYYKDLFLGLVDMAIVNAYIIHKNVSERLHEKPLLHEEFMKELQDKHGG
ncbi:hypothetical protein AeRB84_017703 [Aphanomyces euteiches]|nr:hypothetical protein AeRB84_017703 [Aphanomyces euteiches]